MNLIKGLTDHEQESCTGGRLLTGWAYVGNAEPLAVQIPKGLAKQAEGTVLNYLATRYKLRELGQALEKYLLL